MSVSSEGWMQGDKFPSFMVPQMPGMDSQKSFISVEDCKLFCADTPKTISGNC